MDGQSFKIKIRRNLLDTGLDCCFLRVNWQEFQLILFMNFMFPLFISGTAVLLGFGIYHYQDQIQELSCQVTQAIKEVLRAWSIFVLCPVLIWEILVFLTDFKEKILSCPSVFYSTAEVQDTSTQTNINVDEWFKMWFQYPNKWRIFLINSKLTKG